MEKSEITLRDYFAGLAMQAYMTSPNFESYFDENGLEKCASSSYKLADAMIKERDKK